MEAWQLIVLLGTVILAIAFLRPEQQVKRAPESSAKEIEEAMEYFSANLDEQNGRLLELFQEMKQQSEGQINKLLGRIESLEQQLFFLQQLPASQISSTVPVEQKIAEPKEVNTKPVQLPKNIKDRYSQIFELYHEGKSIEYVAKKLGMNKGEVQLIIQLASQEEQFRV